MKYAMEVYPIIKDLKRLNICTCGGFVKTLWDLSGWAVVQPRLSLCHFIGNKTVAHVNVIGPLVSA